MKYKDSWDKFIETSLPNRNSFYNNLNINKSNNNQINKSDYNYAI